MAKLRKMLGNIEDPVIISLMGLIETQSLLTLAKWSVGYVEKRVLPIYENKNPKELRVRTLITSSREYLDGTVKLKELKAFIKELNQLARETENPISQAAVRAIAAACSTTYSPASALGYTFYAVAAIVYDIAGLQERQDVYDAIALEEFEKILASLQKEAITEEKNPVKINWNC